MHELIIVWVVSVIILLYTCIRAARQKTKEHQLFMAASAHFLTEYQARIFLVVITLIPFVNTAMILYKCVDLVHYWLKYLSKRRW